MVYLYRALQAYQARQRRHDAMNQAAGFLNDDALLAYPLRDPPGGRMFYFWTRIRVLGPTDAPRLAIVPSSFIISQITPAG